MPAASRHCLRADCFLHDSLPEGDGFEPSVRFEKTPSKTDTGFVSFGSEGDETLAGALGPPEMVVEVTYIEWTPDGLLRHVVYLGEREDKLATEVRREPPHGPSHIRSPIGVTYTISPRRRLLWLHVYWIVESTLPRLSLADDRERIDLAVEPSQRFEDRRSAAPLIFLVHAAEQRQVQFGGVDDLRRVPAPARGPLRENAPPGCRRALRAPSG